MKSFNPLQFVSKTGRIGLNLSVAFAVVGPFLQAIAQVTPLPPLPAMTLRSKVAALAAPASSASSTRAGAPLVWDSEFKEISPKPSEIAASFTFWFTNASAVEVTINSVRASCGCTTTKLPALPWKIAPGTNSPIEVSVDLRGKQGVISKAVTVDSTAGSKSLAFKINLPAMPPAKDAPTFPVPSAALDGDRVQNIQLSLGDRQVVFKDAQCATCHADPAKGQTDGALLYSSVCANCHDSPQRAELVTDLRALKHETDLDYWKHWITHGRAGSMMPAFGRAEGGPLDDRQIEELAAYCARELQPPGTTASSRRSI